MKIHFVILITILKPLSLGENPYRRTHDNHPPTVEEKNLNKEWLSFEIKKLFNRRIRRYGRGKKIIEYLVK